jgi:hypothetical protein
MSISLKNFESNYIKAEKKSAFILKKLNILQAIFPKSGGSKGRLVQAILVNQKDLLILSQRF